MDLKCLAVDSNLDIASVYVQEWALRGIKMERVDTMTEAIQKLLHDNYVFVGINGDATDFLPLLKIMRSVTHTPILIATGHFTTEKEVAALSNGADLYARWHESATDNVTSVLAHIDRKANRLEIRHRILVYRDLLISPTNL